MAKKKGNISDIIKKGEYVFFNDKIFKENRIRFSIVEIIGQFNNNLRVKGYEIIPTGLKADLYNFDLKYKGYSTKPYDLGDYFFEKLDYKKIERIIDFKEEYIQIIQKKDYVYYEEWLKLELPNLVSQINDESKYKKIKTRLEKKLKKAKNKDIKKTIRKILEELNKG